MMRFSNSPYSLKKGLCSLIAVALLAGSLSVAPLVKAQELDSVANTLLEQVRNYTWEAPGKDTKDAKAVRYEDVLKQIPDSYAAELGKAHVDEANADAQKLRAENSFLFALIAPKYLEEAGDDQVEAARFQATADLQAGLETQSNRYFDLLSANLAQVAAYYRLLTSEEQLRLDESRFKLGEVTSLAVIQSQNAMLQRWQDFQKADAAVGNLSLLVTQSVDVKPGTRLAPEELQLGDIEARMLVFVQVPEVALNEKSIDKAHEKLLKLAKAQNPELKVLEHQKKALEHLLSGSTNKHDPQHKLLKAQLEQVNLGMAQAETMLSVTLLKLLQEREQNRLGVQSADAQYLLAKKALHHVRVSYKSGFSNNKDVLEAQAALALAQAALGEARLKGSRTDLALLKSVGLLKTELLEEHQPIALEPDKGQI